MTERLDNLILVDVFDNPIGTADKRRAHTVPLLHRAFSVFLINDRGELLLQKRASGKYHSGGLWANACCSHPRPGQDILQAAQQRVQRGAVSRRVAFRRDALVVEVAAAVAGGQQLFARPWAAFQHDHLRAGCTLCGGQPGGQPGGTAAKNEDVRHPDTCLSQ